MGRWLASTSLLVLSLLIGDPARQGAAFAADQVPAPFSADELLDRGFQNLYASDYIQKLRLVSVIRGGRELTRELQIVRRQSERPGKALIRFLAPPTVRRTSILVLENETRADDIYVYLPALRSTRRLSASQRSDSFFGTDFCYEDVEPKRAEDFTASFVREVEDFEPCREIEVRSRDGIESSYHHMVACIEARRGVFHWIEYYKEADAPFKRLVISQDSIREVRGHFIPFSMTMRTAGRDSETRFESDSYEVVDEIPERLFSSWNLEAGDAKRDRGIAD